MQPESSLPHSQVPATCPHPSRSSPHPHIPLPEDSSYYDPPIYVWVFQVVSFPQVSPPKPLYMPLLSSIRSTCPAHRILFDLITRTTFGEQYRSLSPSLCCSPHSPVTPSLSPPQYSPQHPILKLPQPTLLPSQ